MKAQLWSLLSYVAVARRPSLQVSSANTWDGTLPGLTLVSSAGEGHGQPVPDHCPSEWSGIFLSGPPGHGC